LFAVVIFEQEITFATGLLLNNAIIDGIPIKIFPYSGLIDKVDLSLRTQKNERNSLDVINKLIEKEYFQDKSLIIELRKTAKNIDETKNITDKIQKAINYSLKKCQETDSTLEVSDTYSNITEIGFFFY
jgi:hypothetical protein